MQLGFRFKTILHIWKFTEVWIDALGRTLTTQQVVGNPIAKPERAGVYTAMIYQQGQWVQTVKVVQH